MRLPDRCCLPTSSTCLLCRSLGVEPTSVAVNEVSRPSFPSISGSPMEVEEDAAVVFMPNGVNDRW